MKCNESATCKKSESNDDQDLTTNKSKINYLIMMLTLSVTHNIRNKV